MSAMPTAGKVISILERVTETDEVRRDPDVRLFDAAILDSLGLVQLIVAFEEEFGVEISPAEIEREQWATPRKISSYMETLLGQ